MIDMTKREFEELIWSTLGPDDYEKYSDDRKERVNQAILRLFERGALRGEVAKHLQMYVQAFRRGDKPKFREEPLFREVPACAPESDIRLLTDRLGEQGIICYEIDDETVSLGKVGHAVHLDKNMARKIGRSLDAWANFDDVSFKE